MEEAESKQQSDVWTSVNKRRSKLVETLIFRLGTLLFPVSLLSLKSSAALFWFLIMINFVNLILANIYLFYRRKNSENIEPGVGKWVSYLNRERKLDSLVGRCPSAPHAPRGLYIYGNVGSGKFLTTVKVFVASLDITS